MAKFSQFISLIVLFLVLILLGVVGFVVYQIVTDVASKTSQKMEKKNITLSRGGMKVGVKEVSGEKESDKTQSVLFKMWNSAQFETRSLWGWGQGSGAAAPAAGDADKRKTFARSASGH